MPLNTHEFAELRLLWKQCLEAVRVQEPAEAWVELLARVHALQEQFEKCDREGIDAFV
jgi:hypothetical protein